jgi:ABC-type antimicrobial peptide transport system permease subunit
MSLAAIGILAGTAAAVALGPIAANLLYQVSPRDPVSLGAAAVLMLGVAAFAALAPAARAARVDPVNALRAE